MKTLCLTLCFGFCWFLSLNGLQAQNTIFGPNVGIGFFGPPNPYIGPVTPLHIVTYNPQIKLTALAPLNPEGDLGVSCLLSSFETPGDFVVRSGVSGQDLIMTNINHNGALRFGTAESTAPGGGIADRERMTIIGSGLIGMNNPFPIDLLHLSDVVNPNHRVSIRLSSSTTGAVGQLSLARQNGDYANFALENDMILRTGTPSVGEPRSDLILTARNAQGSIRFGTVEFPPTGDVERMIIHQNGNVGIGTVSTVPTPPASKLHVAGAKNYGEALLTLDGGAHNDMRIHFPSFGLQLTDGPENRRVVHLSWSTELNNYLLLSNIQGSGAMVPGEQDFVRISDINGVEFYTNGTEKMRIAADGFVGIGTPEPHANDPYGSLYKLGVNGLIKAKEVRVSLDNWADHVFDPSYRLRPLSEVEEHIREHRHLPGIPSEQKVLDEGIGLGEMQASLLEKIEEMTLYIIELEKRIESLEKEESAGE